MQLKIRSLIFEWLPDNYTVYTKEAPKPEEKPKEDTAKDGATEDKAVEETDDTDKESSKSKEKPLTGDGEKKVDEVEAMEIELIVEVSLL